MLPSQKPESVNIKRFIPDIALFRRSKHRIAKITGQLPLLQTQKQVIIDAETQRFKLAATEWARRSKKFGLVLAGLGGVSLALAIVKGGQIAQANSEIARRKEQLSKPVHDLSASEATNFPWSHGNLGEWLYRPVRITGRPLHNKAMLVPRYKEGYWGFDYIVPLVTKENEDGSVQEGILLNKGWMPHEYESPGARWKIENSLPQTFECYVSLNSELDANGTFFKDGNSIHGRRNQWGHVYLPDMAEKSGFRNKDAVKTALLECVIPDSPLDERNPQHHQMTLTVSEDYPYPKTRAGALQLRKMPWELRGEQNVYMTAGIILSGLAGVARFLV